MHDSRGASLKEGDRVFIEAEVKSLCSGDDTGFCNVTVQVVTPQQAKPPEMTPPTLSAINTRMLTKVAASFLLLSVMLIASNSASAADNPKPLQAYCGECAASSIALHGATLSTVSAWPAMASVAAPLSQDDYFAFQRRTPVRNFFQRVLSRPLMKGRLYFRR